MKSVAAVICLMKANVASTQAIVERPIFQEGDY